MNKLGILKSVSEAVVSVGIGTIVTHAVKSTTPLDLKLYKKLSVLVGTSVLTGLLSNMAAKRTTEAIDDAATQYKNIVDNIVTIQEEPTE